MKSIEWKSVKIMLFGKEVDTNNMQQSINSIASDISKKDIKKIKSQLKIK